MVVFGVLGLSQAAVAQLRLTEIQVVSVAGLRDEDGTAQPWVEIWNPSQTTKVAMNNYKLTDGTTTWTFPPADIMPDEHMIVWLSGKNRRVSTAPLHTDFTPKPGGGSISLLNAAATPVLLSQFDYPAQAADVSWGRDASDAAVTPTLTGFYAVPTPNEPNSYEGPGVAGRVTFSQTSRAFSGTLSGRRSRRPCFRAIRFLRQIRSGSVSPERQLPKRRRWQCHSGRSPRRRSRSGHSRPQGR